jgi:uncharacterized protein YbaP (TraB family)
MRRASILAVLSVALLAPTIAHAAPKSAATPPACAGRDLLATMKQSDPEGYAKIRAAADAVPNARSLLWRIERKGLAPSYLFGTIHSTDPRVTKLPPAVQAAFNSANTVALEYIESDKSNGTEALAKLIAAKGAYEDGNGLTDLLTTAEMAALRKTLAADGLPADGAQALRPWLAAFMLMLPSCEKSRVAAGVAFLDLRIERAATAQGKRVVGLETLAQQIDAIANMAEPAQLSMLKATVATIALRDDALEALHLAYLARDLATALPLSKRLIERAGYDPSSLDVFEQEIAIKRNYGMRDASLPLLEKGGVFIAVGGLHLLGKEGLVELFRAEGYTVTPAE